MWILWVILALVGLVAVGWLARLLMENPLGDVAGGLLWPVVRSYSRRVHRLRVYGRARVPRDRRPGPLVVVANHTAGVDPVLVQAACPFHIRWMMAEDMRLPWLNWFWTWMGVIFVDREGREGAAAREAVRHLNEGGVIGIFPEGGIERPPRQVLPFNPGVGVLVRRTNATVLPIVIDGTPQADPAWSSLWRPSESTLTVLPPVRYEGKRMKPDEIAEDLRRRFMAATGWPANEQWSQAAPSAKGAPPRRRERSAG